MQAQGRHDEAAQILEEALRIQTERGDLIEQGGILHQISRAYYKQGKLHKALESLKTARTVLIQVGESGVAMRREVDRDLFWISILASHADRGT